MNFWSVTLKYFFKVIFNKIYKNRKLYSYYFNGEESIFILKPHPMTSKYITIVQKHSIVHACRSKKCSRTFKNLNGKRQQQSFI